MDQNLEGTFQIKSWDESPFQENEDGSKQSHAKIKQTYSGSIEGDSEIQYLMSYQDPTSAVFVGHEEVTARIAGKSGSFLLQHNGTFEKGVAKSSFRIVSGSGKGDFVGLEGSGSFESTEHGQAKYCLNINA